MNQNLIALSESLSIAYDKLSNEVANVYETNETLLEWERKVASEKNRVLTTHDPKELGANEAARNAKIEEMIAEFREGHRDAEEQNRRAKHFLELARIDVEGSRAQLRCLEIFGTLQLAPPPASQPSAEEPTKRKGRKTKSDPTEAPTTQEAPPDSSEPASEEAQVKPDAPNTEPVTVATEKPNEPRPEPLARFLILCDANRSAAIRDMHIEHLGLLITTIAQLPNATSEEQHIYRRMVDEMMKRDHGYMDPKSADILAHRDTPENPLANLADGEIIERMNALPTFPDTRTAEQESEYQSLSAEMLRRNPAWKDPLSQEVTVPAATAEPEPEATPALVDLDDEI